MPKTIAVLATMDTKGAEADFVRQEIEALGEEALLVNIGVVGPAAVPVHIDTGTVIRTGGGDPDALLKNPTRENIGPYLVRGAQKVLLDLVLEHKIHALLAMGGTQGTSTCSQVMQALPYGFGKIMLSTAASGDTEPFVDIKDITMMFSVSDILGLNPFSRKILANAAGARCGNGPKKRTRHHCRSGQQGNHRHDQSRGADPWRHARHRPVSRSGLRGHHLSRDRGRRTGHGTDDAGGYHQGGLRLRSGRNRRRRIRWITCFARPGTPDRSRKTGIAAGNLSGRRGAHRVAATHPERSTGGLQGSRLRLPQPGRVCPPTRTGRNPQGGQGYHPPPRPQQAKDCLHAAAAGGQPVFHSRRTACRQGKRRRFSSIRCAAPCQTPSNCANWIMVQKTRPSSRKPYER